MGNRIERIAGRVMGGAVDIEVFILNTDFVIITAYDNFFHLKDIGERDMFYETSLIASRTKGLGKDIDGFVEKMIDRMGGMGWDVSNIKKKGEYNGISMTKGRIMSKHVYDMGDISDESGYLVLGPKLKGVLK